MASRNLPAEPPEVVSASAIQTPLLHAPGVRMTGVHKLPQIISTHIKHITDVINKSFPIPKQLEAHRTMNMIPNQQSPNILDPMGFEQMQVKLLNRFKFLITPTTHMTWYDVVLDYSITANTNVRNPHQ